MLGSKCQVSDSAIVNRQSKIVNCYGVGLGVLDGFGVFDAVAVGVGETYSTEFTVKSEKLMFMPSGLDALANAPNVPFPKMGSTTVNW